MNLLFPGSYSVQAIYSVFNVLDFHCFGKLIQRESIRRYVLTSFVCLFQQHVLFCFVDTMLKARNPKRNKTKSPS